jgi:hypothetical protein
MTRTLPPRLAWLAAAALLALGLPRAGAADVETRTFSITIDGKKAGAYHMTIHRADDGTVTMNAQSDVRVTVLAVPVYTYSYQGQEVWKNGRLQHLVSSGKEKGKPFAVRAVLEGAALRVQANGQSRQAAADAWPTSCWQLPPPAYRNHTVTVLGCDTGLDHPSPLQYVGAEQLSLAGQSVPCTHYRVTKDAPHDLWYDARERLARDEWVTDGHRTVLELTAVGR